MKHAIKYTLISALLGLSISFGASADDRIPAFGHASGLAQTLSSNNLVSELSVALPKMLTNELSAELPAFLLGAFEQFAMGSEKGANILQALADCIHDQQQYHQQEQPNIAQLVEQFSDTASYCEPVVIQSPHQITGL